MSLQSIGPSTTVASTVSSTLPTAVSKTKSKKRSKPKKNSKRKMELRSRRIIQKAVPDLETTAALTAANATAPFFKLPQEIKNKIYELVLGGNLLHIKQDAVRFKRNVSHSTKGDIVKSRFTHQICGSPISEKDAQLRFDTEDGSSLYIKDVDLRHWGYAGSGPINVSLLSTCRRIYEETRFMPYSTNTFSFDQSRTLRAFIHLLVQRGVNFNHALRSLHVELADDSRIHGWDQAFLAVTRHRTLLQTIHINVDQGPHWSSSANAFDKEESMAPARRCLEVLGETPAQSVTVVVSDRFLSSRSIMALASAHATWVKYRWTVEEKRVWAKKVKMAIKKVQLDGSNVDEMAKGLSI